MADVPLPPEVGNWSTAWEMLLRTPWVRTRANGRYVTLHDALAEELAQRLIPLHDQDEAWRFRRWQRANEIYARLSFEAEREVTAERTAVRTTSGPL